MENGIAFNSKKHALGITLENGQNIVQAKNDELLKRNTLADMFITRFSTIKFYAADKEKAKTFKNQDDKIVFHLPQYISKETIILPIGNAKFTV